MTIRKTIRSTIRRPYYDLVKPGSGSSQPQPITFTLTSTGTGAGVSTFSIEVSKETTLTLDGTARFYDNSGGTTNEGTSRTVTPGALRVFYLKCPSGTASLVVSDARNLIKWGNMTTNGWGSSTNAASIGGSIESLTSLTSLNIAGSNTLSGSITGLKNLTLLSAHGSNTLSGSVAGLTGLTFLSVAGSNTLSGSAAGLTDLTDFYVTGFNTLSGSVAGLTKLTYLDVRGSNTLTGDIGGSGTAAMVNGITSIVLTGNNQMSEYTSGATWSLNSTTTINPASGYGYSATEIDNILIDMAASLGTVTDKKITLQGSSAARTSASNAAVATLNGKGWTIVTN